MRISRRNFIKAGAASTAIVGAAKPLSTKKWFNEVSASNLPQETIAYTYHTTNCGGRCSFKCTVTDGKLVKIEPNTWDDRRFSTICLKGISEIERLYSPERLQTPLKRVGERGEGKFKPISWDEALDEIEKKYKELKDKYGSDSILMSKSSGIEHPYEFLSTMLGLSTVVYGGIDIGVGNGVNECLGWAARGAVQNEITDWVNSRTIILIGCDILETTITDSKFFMDAKEAGAKIISVDPNYSTTSAKANEWISIRPGTDDALLLGMISIIIDNEWYDEDYMKKNTSSPFLIRSDNGKYLCMNKDEEFDIDTNPYAIWDENTNSLQPYTKDGISPVLEGTFNIDGLNVKTVFTALKETQQEYTLAWAAEKTEIEEETIYNLTERYATAGPAVLGFGYGGPDKWTNSDVVGHAGAILAALTGNIGVVGGAVGYVTHHITSWGAALNVWPKDPKFQANPLPVPTADLPKMKEMPIRAVINIGNTFQQSLANFNQTKEWLMNLDFVVTIDPFHNPCVDLSDIVLPASTPFESEYDVINMQVNRSHVLLSQKVIEPLHDSKSDFQIEKEILARFGLDSHMPENPEQMQRKRLESDDPALEGINIESLRENNFIMRLRTPEEPYRRYTDQKYDTKSGKIELYNESQIEYNQALPIHDPPSEAYEGNPLMDKYPLQFSQARSKYHVHSQFTNSEWLSQLDGGPTLEINPIDAKARNISNGDLVEVFNDRGTFKSKCKLTEAQRPGQVRIHEGWWSSHMVDGNLQNLTNDKFLERQYVLSRGPVIPYFDTLVEVKKV